nr:hypothetical protein [uncultured Roseateles sp.]
MLSHLEPITQTQKSRAEVLADLQTYRESGLAAVDRTEDTSLGLNQLAKAEARYAELEASPKYAALVQRFAAKEGKGEAGDRRPARLIERGAPSRRARSLSRNKKARWHRQAGFFRGDLRSRKPEFSRSSASRRPAPCAASGWWSCTADGRAFPG